MTASLTTCPLCTLCGWHGEVELLGAVPANMKVNGSIPIMALWRCSEDHEWTSLIVVSKVEKEKIVERTEW